MSAEEASTVSTTSLLAEQRTLLESSTSTNADVVAHVQHTSNIVSRAKRRAWREQQRLHRIHGRLTDISLNDIAAVRGGKCDFFIENTIACIRGSCSQFDARGGRTKKLMPPQTHDCCQTFSTIAAVILSSLGLAVTMQECSGVSTVNYLLYISAWLHQLSAPLWPQRRARPTVGDLNTALRLHEFFPSRVNEGEFEVLFYNQRDRAKELVDQLCRTVRRNRDADSSLPVCGYIIASGDYTVSIFSLAHDVKGRPHARYSEAWSLYICDSHGTQPWSCGKACLTGITVGVLKAGVEVSNGVVAKEEGLRYFAMILFALLEDHRIKTTSSQQVPYMTWSPIRRPRAILCTAQELVRVIDDGWIPFLMKNPVIAREAKKYGFAPLKCFMGLSASKPVAANGAME
ncbi:hypothetical protein TraAM80_07369 [Trypanosoma rangeli]|uniref:Uncharacterized protein n=1 Tax=Trypanosoma rangeli TaxID=5698 RepID=A0A422N5V3_TRYRA|nr:uncharacterized protein TraAM80_07369 [Trypanosoma rangeli]RNF00853.1 hypothetical protein TraAM80_07369 [Trypanosoma rangeli]|eukprot:RNF00853.1 hypothetical protein TraAM80_07369 [Trypanosoma rangeli]